MHLQRTDHRLNLSVPFAPSPSLVSYEHQVPADQEFRRIEDKYLVPLHLSLPLLEELFHQMNPSYPSAETRFNLINSLYFDSENLDFFQHHFMDLSSRYKVRIRKYAPNGHWTDDPLLLEVKKKKDGETKKTRFMILQSHLDQLQRGKPLEFSPELRDLNKTMKKKKIVARLEKVNNLFDKFALRPTFSVEYHRLAFEKDDLRVTLDRELTGKNIYPIPVELSQQLRERPWWSNANLLLGKFQTQSYCVLEIKHQNNIPEWLQELLNKYKIEKTSFSKYCWFMGQCLSYN